MKLVVVSPEKTIYSGIATSVIVPGEKGTFEILDNHAPIISSLQIGKVVVKNGGKEETFDVKSGFVEVAENTVSICVEQ